MDQIPLSIMGTTSTFNPKLDWDTFKNPTRLAGDEKIYSNELMSSELVKIHSTDLFALHFLLATSVTSSCSRRT